MKMHANDFTEKCPSGKGLEMHMCVTCQKTWRFQNVQQHQEGMYKQRFRYYMVPSLDDWPIGPSLVLLRKRRRLNLPCQQSERWVLSRATNMAAARRPRSSEGLLRVQPSQSCVQAISG